MNHTAKFALRRATQVGAGLSALALALTAGTGTAFAAEAPQVTHASASVLGGNLSVRGTASTDDIEISLADATHLAVDFHDGTTPQTFDISTFGLITVNLGGGNDVFLEQPSGGVLATKPLVVFGGDGNDSIQGGDANDTLYGGNGDDVISGGDGVDLIFGGGGDDVVNGNHGNDTEILGEGDDTAVWNPGEGSDAVSGGTGTDKLVFNGSGTADDAMSLFADGGHAIFERDPGAVRMDLVHVERVDAAALAGKDLIGIGDLTGTGLTQVDVDLSSQGVSDGQQDTVQVEGTNHADNIAVTTTSAGEVNVTGLHTAVRVIAADEFAHLDITTRLGKDTATVSNGASQTMAVQVHFGTPAL